MASLFMLAALILFGAPSIAQASPVVLASDTGSSAHISLAAGGQVGTGSLWSSVAAPADTGDGDQHAGSRCAGCCTKIKCPLAHHGIVPASPLPTPPLGTLAVPFPSGLLSEGIGTLPALRPPRASL